MTEMTEKTESDRIISEAPDVTTRHLPPAEWHKLAHTELGAVASLLTPDTQVVVIEDAGQIVACWSLLPVWHAEGVWIAPSYRRSVSVVTRLLAAMRAMVATVGAKAVVTSSASPEVEALLEKLDARPLPARHFLWELS